MASNLKDDPYYVRRNPSSHQSVNDDQEYGYDHLANELQQQVKAKPISSVAIAVGVGVGAGLLLSTLLSSEREQQERFARRIGNYLSGNGSLRSTVESFLPNSITDRYCG